MAQNVNPTFVKTPTGGITSITTGVGANLANVTIYTGAVNGSKISSLTISANTSATQDVRVSVLSGALGAFVNGVSVAATAGIASAFPPVDGFGNSALPVDSDGNRFLLLPSTAWSLVAQTTTLSSQWQTGATIWFFAEGGDF